MLTSIITPTLNNGKLIKKCIESVKTQKVKTEHIIIDGGSNDSTIEILKKTSQVKWISEPDKGMYDAINKGLKIAKGEIIGYLNADDRYYNSTVARVQTIFKDRPDIDFLYGSCTYIDHNERELYTFKPLPYVNKLLKNMDEITWAQPSCFWRRKVHDRIGYFDDSLKYCGDYDFFLRMILNDVYGYRIRGPLSFFMIHGNALSIKSKKEMSNEYRRLVIKYNLKRNSILAFLGKISFRLINIAVYPKKIMTNSKLKF